MIITIRTTIIISNTTIAPIEIINGTSNSTFPPICESGFVEDEELDVSVGKGDCVGVIIDDVTVDDGINVAVGGINDAEGDRVGILVGGMIVGIEVGSLVGGIGVADVGSGIGVGENEGEIVWEYSLVGQKWVLLNSIVFGDVTVIVTPPLTRIVPTGGQSVVKSSI